MVHHAAARCAGENCGDCEEHLRGQHVPGADEDSTFRVQTEGGMTGAIHQGQGVKQGCPLSPLLFNLAIEGLLRGIETTEATGYSFSEGAAVRVLAYADDLVATSSSEEDARALVARMEEFASWARLSFRVEKCASLSTSYSARHHKFLK